MEKKEFLSKFKPRIEKVDIEGVGTFCMRKMSAGERAAYEARAFAGGSVNVEVFYAELLIRVLCDGDGNRWFNDNEQKEVNAIDANVIHKLAEQALKINALDPISVEDAKKK